ncbi:MAG TPA: tetratricopeptide repeat protein [Ohtaekwangia sp.]|nr:tetratricopeptide repeat protein [Ohtaekwangia sp.]
MFKNIKAVLQVCLFLLAGATHAQEWSFDSATNEAYSLALNLQTDEARVKIPNPETPQEHYVLSLAEALELLVTEDIERYRQYERNFEERAARKLKKRDADELFLEAEIHLHWAFVYLKFGHEFDAALNFRHAYNITQELRDRFPAYKAILKTDGLLEVIIGSIPEKYNWVLSVMNMQGTVKIGLKEFETIKSADHPLSFEAGLWHALTQAFILQNPEQALTEFDQLLAEKPTNRLALFLGANLHLKNNNSEEALKMLVKLDQHTAGLPLYYSEYLKGEIFLHKAEYLNSISAYRSFLNQYKGQNYVKDAYYKIGLCYWLNGNTNDALATFKQAKSAGKEATEPDKYAARNLDESALPNIPLTKVRYLTDGGYYNEAKKILNKIRPDQLKSRRDVVEYHYRKARLAHKMNDLASAREAYKKTIDTGSDEAWYFAPNACLQLGYIARDNNEIEAARTYFSRALSYKKHEYKNSIDSKARSALAQTSDAK